MKLAFTLLALLFTACGKPFTVDPQLQPYFGRFEQKIGVSAGDISAEFADTTKEVNPLGEMVAVCTIYTDGSRIIQVDAIYWATLADGQREQLVFHELGHCALYLQHTPGNISGGAMNGCPISIMNPYAFGGEIDCYDANPAYYYQELRSL